MMKKLHIHQLPYKGESREGATDLLLSSAIPASALYHAMNAANRAKNPPALMIGGLGSPMASRWR